MKYKIKSRIAILLILIFSGCFITVFSYFKKVKPMEEQQRNLSNIRKIEKIILTNKKTNNKLILQKDNVKRLLLELKESHRGENFSKSIRTRVYITVISEDVTLHYSILPGVEVKGEFMLYREKKDKQIKVDRIYSKWLFNFLKRNNLLK